MLKQINMRPQALLSGQIAVDLNVGDKNIKHESKTQ